MKRAVILALAVALWTLPAHADFAVIDPTEIAQIVKQIGWLKSQYDQLTQATNALTNSLNVGGLSPGLLLPGLQTPMGGMLNQMPNLVNGSSLAPGASTFLQQDQYYQSPSNNFMANTMNSNAVSMANIKAIAQQLMNTNSTRIGQLNGLMTALTAATDVSQVARINGRLATENQTLGAQQNQFSQLALMVQMQQRTIEQRTQQKTLQDDEDQVSATRGGALGAPGGLPVPPQPPAAFVDPIQTIPGP